MSKKKPEIKAAEPNLKKKKKKELRLYLIAVLAFFMFFSVIYPRFTPVLAKYTVVKNLRDKGEDINRFDMSEPSYSSEKRLYIVILSEKKTGKKREVGISTKFLPTTIEFDIEQ